MTVFHYKVSSAAYPYNYFLKRGKTRTRFCCDCLRPMKSEESHGCAACGGIRHYYVYCHDTHRSSYSYCNDCAAGGEL